LPIDAAITISLDAPTSVEPGAPLLFEPINHPSPPVAFAMAALAASSASFSHAP
jgi:hypothetical protein